MSKTPMLSPYSGQSRVELLNASGVQVQIVWSALREIFALLRAVASLRQEVACVGKVPDPKIEACGILTYRIEEVKILRQRCDPVETTLDPTDLGITAAEWIEQAGGQVNPLRFWGHAHLGSPHPSSQDDFQMMEFRRGEPAFFIRGIFGFQTMVVSAPVINVGDIPVDRDYGGSSHHGCVAEFSVFDYSRGIVFRDVPWELCDTWRETEIPGLVEKIRREKSREERKGKTPWIPRNPHQKSPS